PQIHTPAPGARHHMAWLFSAEQGDPAVALVLCAEPIMVRISGLLEEGGLHLIFHGLGLLKADHVRVHTFQPFHKPLAQGRPDSVHIVGYYFHVKIFLKIAIVDLSLKSNFIQGGTPGSGTSLGGAFPSLFVFLTNPQTIGP